MSVLVTPAVGKKESKEWPTLGDQVGAWIERHLVFGPGDLRGEPAKLDDEKAALLRRMYQLFPKGHAQEGRRRFRRVAISQRKGWAKSEFAAWIAAAELHPHAPVRFTGWKRAGRGWVPAHGTGVKDAYLPLVAYTEEQSEDLVYGALLAIIDLSKSIRGDFDLGLERIMRVGGDGKAVALAAAPDARDGARTTFQVSDEVHRWTSPRLKQAHRTMLANLPKRKLADPWGLEITTAPAPGEGSVAEDTMEFAKAVAEGRAADSRFFFFHRQATEGKHDLATEEGVRDAVLEASGPVAEWSDIDGIVDQWKDPTADRAYLARVWLNQPIRAADRAFDGDHWKKLLRKNHKVPERAKIVLGFDGRPNDSTAIIGCEISTGYLFKLGFWERPLTEDREKWRAPVLEMNEAMDEAFRRFDVWRLYADPPYWETVVADWEGKHGEERVIAWATARPRPMANAVQGFFNAIEAKELSHDGNEDLARHIGNTFRRPLQIRDDRGLPLFAVQKERPDSPNNIDMTVTAIICWEARTDALAAGLRNPPPEQDYRVDWAG